MNFSLAEQEFNNLIIFLEKSQIMGSESTAHASLKQKLVMQMQNQQPETPIEKSVEKSIEVKKTE